MAQWLGIRLLMQETWVRYLVPEDLLEEEMATHSSVLAWETGQWNLVNCSARARKESGVT